MEIRESQQTRLQEGQWFHLHKLKQVNWNMLELDCDDGAQLCKHTKTTELYILKWFNFMVYNLYLNKAAENYNR